METAEKADDQNGGGDAAEVPIEAFENGISQAQLTGAAVLVGSGSRSDGNQDGPNPEKKPFLDPKRVQSFKRRLLENKCQALEQLVPTLTGFFIQRVPDCLRQFDERAYTPQFISIGPFHYDKRSTHLKDMEKHKMRYLNDIVDRIGEGCLEGFMTAVKVLEPIARSFYSENIGLNSDSFVEMMVPDSCFIIELFLKAYNEDADDLLLSSEAQEIGIDLLKLENQIPFVILQHLFDLMNLYNPSLPQLALAFFNFFQPNYLKLSRLFSHRHLLHLLHASLRSTSMEMVLDNGGDVKMTHSASALQHAGIKIKNGTADTFLDIRFQKEKSVMEIPTFTVEHNAVPVLLNLVALEHSGVFYPCFMEYISFMNCLMGTATDVRFLCENGIIENRLGSHEQVADLFNKITSNITSHRKGVYLLDVYNDINRSFGNKFHICRAGFNHNFHWFLSFMSRRRNGNCFNA